MSLSVSLAALLAPGAGASVSPADDSSPTLPDLRVEDAFARLIVYKDNASTELQIIVVLWNSGGQAAGPFDLFLRVCDVTKQLPGPAPCSVYTETATVRVDGLEAGHYGFVHAPFTPPAPGRYVVQAVVDSASEIAESDETNNAGQFGVWAGKIGA